jgi:hypothetical protein
MRKGIYNLRTNSYRSIVLSSISAELLHLNYGEKITISIGGRRYLMGIHPYRKTGQTFDRAKKHWLGKITQMKGDISRF